MAPFFVLIMMAASSASGAESAPRIWIVKDGKPAADIYAGATEWSVAEKVVRRIEQWSGAKLLVLGASEPPAARREMTRLVIGTTKSVPELSRMVDSVEPHQPLGPQGYTIRATESPSVIAVAGTTSTSAGYGAFELLNYRFEMAGRDIWCEPFEVSEEPVLPYRWLWLSTSYAHWDPKYGNPHVTDETTRTYGPHPDGKGAATDGYPGQMMGDDAYRNTYRAMVDWMSEHKLNGALIFGYFNSGLDLGREVAAYGKTHGVDIIAGVGTMGYWGTYYGGYNEMNLDTLLSIRPELTRKNERGAVTICPSLEETQEYWRSAGRWIAEAAPELGGLYLENGDLQTCPCEACKANREKEANDTGCYWDMMASEVPVIEGAAAVRPDWKYVYASYTSFTPDGWKAGTTRNPPRFPKQFQPNAICQWTVTGMNEKNWPEGAKAPTPHSVGLFHSPSVWGAPDGTDRWWAGPGSSHDDASRLVRFYCNRMASSGFEGLVVKGMKNHHSPGPLLTYLALEEFSWHPEESMANWERNRLSKLLGGVERAATYLRIARDSTRDAAARRKLVEEAQAVADAADLPGRARPYWQDLAEEMRYRIRLEETLAANAKKDK